MKTQWCVCSQLLGLAIAVKYPGPPSDPGMPEYTFILSYSESYFSTLNWHTYRETMHPSFFFHFKTPDNLSLPASPNLFLQQSIQWMSSLVGVLPGKQMITFLKSPGSLFFFLLRLICLCIRSTTSVTIWCGFKIPCAPWDSSGWILYSCCVICMSFHGDWILMARKSIKLIFIYS